MLTARSTDFAAKVIIITTPIGRSVINAPGTGGLRGFWAWQGRFLDKLPLSLSLAQK